MQSEVRRGLHYMYRVVTTTSCRKYFVIPWFNWLFANNLLNVFCPCTTCGRRCMAIDKHFESQLASFGRQPSFGVCQERPRLDSGICCLQFHCAFWCEYICSMLCLHFDDASFCTELFGLGPSTSCWKVQKPQQCMRPNRLENVPWASLPPSRFELWAAYPRSWVLQVYFDFRWDGRN